MKLITLLNIVLVASLCTPAYCKPKNKGKGKAKGKAKGAAKKRPQAAKDHGSTRKGKPKTFKIAQLDQQQQQQVLRGDPKNTNNCGTEVSLQLYDDSDALRFKDPNCIGAINEGRVIGEDGTSTLALRIEKTGRIAASINDFENQVLYQMVGKEDEDMVITATPLEDMMPELEGIPPPGLEMAMATDTISLDSSQRMLRQNKDRVRGAGDSSSRILQNGASGDVIDVMVVWTIAAECKNSGAWDQCPPNDRLRDNMMARIDLAIDETNEAFQLSGVNTRLRLVHAYRHPTYREVDSSRSYTALEDITLGRISGVHEERIKHGADIVAFMINANDACGVAWNLKDRVHKDWMYSVSHYNCATGYYSFGHEIAHNFGCNHDRGTAKECDANQHSGYGYGYRDPNADFRSIMGYDCNSNRCSNERGGSCMRVQRFSNNQFSYQGKKIGDNDNNCARLINDRRVEVANLFPSADETDSPTESPTEEPTSSPTEEPTSSPTEEPTPSPTEVHSQNPSASPSFVPSSLPSSNPSSKPSLVPSSNPSSKPSLEHSSSPTSKPSMEHSSHPSSNPSLAPSSNPSQSPSDVPSNNPSSEPTVPMPSSSPSNAPTSSISPSHYPSSEPSSTPTKEPTSSPSNRPSSSPTNPVPTESASPSVEASASPSMEPSTSPESPSSTPSVLPSKVPTLFPSASPSAMPSASPSKVPTLFPSASPSAMPSAAPVHPSSTPSTSPSKSPSENPIALPSTEPSKSPTRSPSSTPSGTPSQSPSDAPTDLPSSSPSWLPTSSPSDSPSNRPTSLEDAAQASGLADAICAANDDNICSYVLNGENVVVPGGYAVCVYREDKKRYQTECRSPDDIVGKDFGMMITNNRRFESCGCCSNDANKKYCKREPVCPQTENVCGETKAGFIKTEYCYYDKRKKTNKTKCRDPFSAPKNPFVGCGGCP